MRNIILLLLAEKFLQYMDKKIKADEKAFEEMSERIKLKRELNGRATKHEIDL